MPYRLLKTFALASAVVLSGLACAACGAGKEGGAAAGGTNANASQTAGGATQVATPSGAAASAGQQQIQMEDDVFQPALLTVAAGTKVTWVNKGHKAHTVVSNDKLFDSGLVNVGGEFSHTFTSPGTYLYHCAPHAKMVGQIVVK